MNNQRGGRAVLVLGLVLALTLGGSSLAGAVQHAGGEDALGEDVVRVETPPAGAEEVAAGPPGLPVTGGDVMGFVLIAGGLMVAGTVLVVGGRRRKAA